ncbi:MAG TPA: DUF4389 domain-containing protein [Marinagarivorans sp.]
MNPELKKNLSNADYWFRALYVILFLLLAKLAGFFVLVIALVQILFTLLAGAPNSSLVRWGDSLAKFLFALFNFVMCKSQEKPFPFADWPTADSVTADSIAAGPVEHAPAKEDASVHTEASVDGEPIVNAAAEDFQQSPSQSKPAAQEPDDAVDKPIGHESEKADESKVKPEKATKDDELDADSVAKTSDDDSERHKNKPSQRD